MGLAFECRGCGRCCAGPDEGYVWVTADEIVRIAEHLGITEAQMRRKHVRKVGRRFSLNECNGTKDCVFLTPADGSGDRGCRIYDARPRQCIAWPFWAGNLRSPDAWALAAERCMGINRGQLFTREQIEDKSNGAAG